MKTFAEVGKMKDIQKLEDFESLDVHELLRTIDEKTANEMMKGFSERYGFRTIVIGGKVFTTAKELMKVFGYSDEWSVRKLLQEYEVETFGIQDLAQTQPEVASVKSLISNTFGITHAPALSKLKLLDYRAFLVIALNSRTEKAKEVKEYVIQMEKEARQRMVLAQKGMTPEALELAKEDPILAMIEAVRQVRLRQIELERKQKELETRQEKLEKEVKAISSPRISYSEVLSVLSWVGKVARVWRQLKSYHGEHYTQKEAREYILSKLLRAYGFGDVSQITKDVYPEIITKLRENYRRLKNKLMKINPWLFEGEEGE